MPKTKHKRRDAADGVVGGKKRCRRCGKRKVVSGKDPQFYKDKDTADGYRDYCKPCEKRMNEKYKAKAAKRAKSGKGKSKRNGKANAKRSSKPKAAKRKATKRKVNVTNKPAGFMGSGAL